jgi:RND family efflux transporter MFP subunit
MARVMSVKCPVRRASFLALLACGTLFWQPGTTAAQVLQAFTEPIEHSELATSQSGTLFEIRVKLGESVRKGQIIASLDTRSLQASLKTAQLRAATTAEVTAAQAKQRQAQLQLEKLKSVIEKGHATQFELEKAEIELVVAESELELAQEKHAEHQADVERIQAEIEQRITRSPFDGTITQIHLALGEFASSANPNIATVVRLDRLRVKFYLATADARRLTASQTVPVDVDGVPAEGEIEFLSPVTDPKSGLVRVDVLIDNPRGTYRAGLPCRLAIANPTTSARRSADPRSILKQP